MAGIFNAAIWNNTIFNTGAAAVTPATGGKGDNDGRVLRRPIKPTGLIDRPRKARKEVDDRVDEARELHAEVTAKVAREFSEENVRIAEASAIETMSMRDIDAEIGLLLRKKLRTDEDELMLLLLMAAAAA